jgi:hypothetical protein
MVLRGRRGHGVRTRAAPVLVARPESPEHDGRNAEQQRNADAPHRDIIHALSACGALGEGASDDVADRPSPLVRASAASWPRTSSNTTIDSGAEAGAGAGAGTARSSGALR